MKIAKHRFFSIFIKACSLSAIVLLAFSSLFSCSNNTQSSSNDAKRIAALESQLAALQANKVLLESEYMDSINALESQIASLKGQIGATPPASSGKPSTSEPDQLGFEYLIENDQVTITAYNGKSTDLIIPASINGYPVVAIADNAFENSSIVSVSMPETLKSIGWFAFSSCASLERVIIPKNVTEIGYYAFYNTPNPVIYAPAGSYAYQYAKSYGMQLAEE